MTFVRPNFTSTYLGFNACSALCLNSVLNVKAVVAAFNQEKALVGAFSVITNLRMELFQTLVGNSGVAVASVDNTVYTKLNQAQPSVLNWALKLVS